VDGYDGYFSYFGFVLLNIVWNLVLVICDFSSVFASLRLCVSRLLCAIR